MSDNRWSANRRTFVKTAGAAGVVGLAGCSDGGTSGDSGNSATEVTWVMNPAEEEIDIQVQYQPMFEYLESEADIEIIEQPTASYSGRHRSSDARARATGSSRTPRPARSRRSPISST